MYDSFTVGQAAAEAARQLGGEIRTQRTLKNEFCAFMRFSKVSGFIVPQMYPQIMRKNKKVPKHSRSGTPLFKGYNEKRTNA